MKNIFITSLVVLFAATGCDSSIGDLESKQKSSNVATTEKDGVLTGTISIPASGPQVMVTGATSTFPDASVTFGPTSLSATTSVSMGAAKDQSSQIVSESGTGAVVAQVGTPLFVGAAAGDSPALANPMTISLPLPLSQSNMSLTAASGKLVFLYAIYTSAGWKSGIKLLTVDNLVGTYLNMEVKGLGYFQIAYLVAAGADKEVTSAIRPTLKGPDPTAKPFGCYRSALFLCQRYGKSNAGEAATAISECKANGGQAVSECPTANFVSSCSYSTNDLKYYFYLGHKNATQADCTGADAKYTTTYSAEF